MYFLTRHLSIQATPFQNGTINSIIELSVKYTKFIMLLILMFYSKYVTALELDVDLQQVAEKAWNLLGK